MPACAAPPGSVKAEPWILGFSASHNGAVCLLKGERLVVAIQEERLSGEKRARLRRLEESLALRYCLDHAGISVDELDVIAGCWFSGERTSGSAVSRQGWRGLQVDIPHHLGHAWGSFVQSGFDDAAVLVVDGQGGVADALPDSERVDLLVAGVPGGAARPHEIISLYHADASGIRCLQKHVGEWVVGADLLGRSDRLLQFGSLGGMFSAATDRIFGSAMDAGKVMGLAALGRPCFPVGHFFDIRADGTFQFSDQLPRSLPQTRPWPADQQAHADLAASTQAALEVALEHLVRTAAGRSGSRRLCLAGGVALNNVANEKLVALGLFDEIFVMPAAEDSGPAIGAAYYGLTQWRRREDPSACPPLRIHAPIVQDRCGREYGTADIEAALGALPWLRAERPADLLEETVRLLTDGAILGWFQGGSELGPRALGQRSILADPRRADAKDALNLKVKHRESFRPFAPAILEEAVGDWFQVPARQPTSPFMLRTFAFLPDRAAHVPAVVHHDGSGRLQTLTAARNGRFHALVARFAQRTGVPMLVNTSFNVMGEPMVETPEDALFNLLYTALDAVVLEDHIVRRDPAYPGLDALVPRLATVSIRVNTPVGDRAEAGDAQTIVARVQRPWGEQEFQLTPPVLRLVQQIDGRRSAGEIRLHLESAGHWTLGESVFRQTLRKLRRRGLLRFNV